MTITMAGAAWTLGASIDRAPPPHRAQGEGDMLRRAHDPSLTRIAATPPSLSRPLSTPPSRNSRLATTLPRPPPLRLCPCHSRDSPRSAREYARPPSLMHPLVSRLAPATIAVLHCTTATTPKTHRHDRHDRLATVATVALSQPQP